MKNHIGTQIKPYPQVLTLQFLNHISQSIGKFPRMLHVTMSIFEMEIIFMPTMSLKENNNSNMWHHDAMCFNSMHYLSFISTYHWEKWGA